MYLELGGYPRVEISEVAFQFKSLNLLYLPVFKYRYKTNSSTTHKGYST